MPSNQTTHLMPLTSLRQHLHQIRATLLDKTQRDTALCLNLQNWLNHYLNNHPNIQKPLAIAAFWPIRDEPNITPWLELMSQNQDLKILLPCILEKNTALIFKQWEPNQPMIHGAYSIPEPQGEVHTPDLLFVPTLGFTSQGDRLGYGGGYYDRTLEFLRTIHPTLLAIGVAYQATDLSSYNYQAATHDQALDWIIHDSGVIQCKA